MEKSVQIKYRLFRRRNPVYYWQANDSSKQGTLRTTDRREAERLLNAMNESHREPTINLNLARAYLAAHDPKMAQRTWQAVMNEMATHGIPTTQERCARGFEASRTTRSAANHSCKQPAKIYSRSCTRTETASPTISDDFTTWLSIWGGSRGPFSQSEHGLKSVAKANARSRCPTNAGESNCGHNRDLRARAASVFHVGL